MKLRDPFLFKSDQPDTKSAPSFDRLAGIGDRDLRQAQDYLQVANDGPTWSPALGEAVEFAVPQGDGLRRAGRVHQFQGADAIVHVADGEFALVPMTQLAPLSKAKKREAQKRDIKAALSRADYSKLAETRELVPMGTSGTDFAMTLSYTAGTRPSSDDIIAYVEAKYPGARIMDGDDSHPNRVGIILSFAAAQASGASAADASERTMLAMAASAPQFDFVETAIEEDGRGLVAHFEVRQAGRPVFLRNGELTTVLAEDAVPAAGLVRADGAWFHGPNGLVAAVSVLPEYSSDLTMHQDDDSTQYVKAQIPGTNPPGTHDPAPGVHVIESPKNMGFAARPKIPLKMIDTKREMDRAREIDEGAAKAKERRKRRTLEQQTQNMPAPTLQVAENDGEQRESIGGPGLHIAVDEVSKDYYEDYFGDYGKKQVEDVDARRVAFIREAWAAEGREASATDMLWALGVLTSFDRVGQLQQPATAQPPQPANHTDLANALINAMGMDARAKAAVDKVMSRYLAKVPAEQRAQIRANDPTTLQQLLPQALSGIDEGTRNRLTRQFAPDQNAAKATGLGRLNPKNWGVEKGREQMQRGLEVQKLMRPSAPASSAPAPSAPASPAAPASATPSTSAPAPAAPAQPTSSAPAPNATIPAGTNVKMQDGSTVALPSDTQVNLPNLPAKAQNAPTTNAPAPSAPAAAPAQARAGFIELTPGTEAWNAEGKKVTLDKAAEARVLSRQGGVTWVRTADGQVLVLEKTAAAPAMAELHFRLESISRRGDYICGTVVWDVDAAESMSPANIMQAIRSFVKTRASAGDMGFIGRPVIEDVDMSMGVADIKVRSSDSRIGPMEVVDGEEHVSDLR